MGNKPEVVDLCGYGVNLVNLNQSGTRLIVLLHGFGAGIFSWREVLEPLAELGQVIAYDRPAFGETERPRAWTGTNPYSIDGQLELLEAVIARYRKGRQLVVVGHSAGGQLAAEFAVRHPGVIDLLILEDPAILASGPPAAVTAMFRAEAFDRVGPRIAERFGKLGDRLLYASWFDQGKITPEILDAYHAPMRRDDWAAGFFEFLRAPRGTIIQKKLGELDLPVFVISGEHDRVVKVEQTFKVTEQIAGHRIYLVPNAGHIPHEEQPSEFMRVVRNFIFERS